MLSCCSANPGLEADLLLPGPSFEKGYVFVLLDHLLALLVFLVPTLVFIVYLYLVMQLAIDEDRRVQKPDEGLEIKAKAGSA